MTRVLRRLAAAPVEELRVRGRERAWVAIEALQYAWGGGWGTREDLAGQLAGEGDGLQAARTALRNGDWTEANAALRDHFRHRQSRFVLDPARRPGTVSAITARYPLASELAAARADQILRDRYDLLGYRGLSFAAAGGVDWHLDPVHQRRAPNGFWARIPYLDPFAGDHKIIWEINRHQHWLALGRAFWLTGRPGYARRFTTELRGWLRANPPLSGINWASMLELAFRSVSWTWAVHFFADFDEEDGTGWLVDLLGGLIRQLDHVARHLSRYFSPNTHLLGEGLALYVAGRSLPELASARSWEELGRDVLIGEATAQVKADGGHAELSPHYHRYALDFYLLALTVARRTEDPAARVFGDVAGRMASFCRSIADDRGWLPTIGDDDGGLLFPICGRLPADASDSLSLAAALLERPELAVGDPPEEVVWMFDGAAPAPASPAGAPDTPASRLFPDTGYAVLRAGGDRAVVDVGPHGFLNGGHAHADALSVVLSVAGTPLLIDPGTATYTMDADVRDRFRSTAMHNTVVIDGRPQSAPDGPFNWRTRANACDVRWSAEGAFGCVEAEHDGYAPLVHRRAVILAGHGLWIVADHILGTGRHEAVWHWHLEPGWSPRSGDTRSGALVHPGGTHAALVSTAGEARRLIGDREGLGWYAPVYGRIVPSPVLRFAVRDELPLSVVTAMAGGAAPVGLAIRAVPAAGPADGWWRTAVQMSQGDAIVVVLSSTPLSGPTPAGPRGMQRVQTADGELATDARIAILRFSRDGEPLTLHALEATAVIWNGRHGLEISQLSAAQDLHLDQDALGRLSRPSSQLPASSCQ